ncbi:MAG: alpha/beta fold hydrolase [Ruminococcus flavefaciens]|nr:alpha/beta fold hydrolase [Ruminococcus flavefaciens]
MQLFCFPCAGGTADFFHQLDPWFGPSVQLVKLEYAGHGTRHREPLYGEFAQLADDLYREVKRLYRPGGAYALFGYSMGSAAAAEVLVRILRDGALPPPERVFLAAHGPFVKRELLRFQGGEADEWVKRRVVSLGGVPEKLLENRTFWRMYLPLYRADFMLITHYDFDKLTLACEIPLTGLYGDQDLPPEEMKAWKRHFHGECEFVEYPGNHFFITEHSREVAGLICSYWPEDSGA